MGLRINATRETTQTVHGVSAKRPANEESREENRRGGGGQGDGSGQERAPASPEEIARVIAEFTQQMMEHGFVTRAEGEPPEVCVFDKEGRELRRVTLAELLEQSEAFQPRGLTRGRLLDRKY
jgi:hypothetical protein